MPSSSPKRARWSSGWKLTRPADQTVQLHFEVKDTGIGIAKDKRSLFLRPFRRPTAPGPASTAERASALQFLRRLVDMMGGRMWVESESGPGSTFHFMAMFGAAGLTVPASRQHPDLGGLRVLVIDDNRTNRDILAEVAHRMRYAALARRQRRRSHRNAAGPPRIRRAIFARIDR